MSLPSISFYPPLAPGALGRHPSESLPYPLTEEDCSVVSRGRHAIWLAAQALGLGPGSSVLMPAWHHGAEVEALALCGAEIVFYDLDERLEPDPSVLDGLIGPRTRALFITHYLGFPQDAGQWRSWCDERGLLLIEDAAHACLSRTASGPAGSVGDAAVWCLFKSFAVPDGAALRLPGRLAGHEPHARRVGVTEAARRQAQWLLQRSPGLARSLDRHPRANGRYDHAAEIALGDARAEPLASTMWLLPRVADAHAAWRRRANFTMLFDELGSQVLPPFAHLPDGAVPLGFPISCSDKPAALRRLADAGVDAVDFWSEAHPLAAGAQAPHAEELRRSTVLLPVHQELRPGDLERVAAAARVRREPRSRLRVDVTDDIGDLEPEWSQLAWGSGNVFATPEWAAAWCRHFLGGRPLRLFTFRAPGGRLVAVLPAYVASQRPMSVLRLVGHGPGDELGPVCDPRERAIVGRALRAGLPGCGSGLVLLEQVPRELGWSAMTGAHVLREGPSPIIRVRDPNWDAFVASRSRRLRKEIRRSETRLASDDDLQVREGGALRELDADLQALFDLHAARWDGAETSFTRHRRFHRDFAQLAAERGWLRLTLLEDGGRPIAATYGFRYAGVEFDYQGGRDPRCDGSPGFMLLASTIRMAFESGVCEYRLLRGGEWYKQRLSTGDRGVETFALGRGVLGSAGATVVAHLPNSLADPLRRRLRV